MNITKRIALITAGVSSCILALGAATPAVSGLTPTSTITQAPQSLATTLPTPSLQALELTPDEEAAILKRVAQEQKERARAAAKERQAEEARLAAEAQAAADAEAKRKAEEEAQVRKREEIAAAKAQARSVAPSRGKERPQVVAKATSKTSQGGGPGAPDAKEAPAPSNPPATKSVLGLKPKAMVVYNAVTTRWSFEAIGGYRSSSRSNHQLGGAIDFMTYKDSAKGWAVAHFLVANAKEFDIDHIIFEQKIWTPYKPYWRQMEDRGSITQNHYDHVHVSVKL